MATVTGYTKAKMDAIVDATIVSGAIDEDGHLILTTHDGTLIDAGAVLGSVPSASTTVAGLVELATSAEATTGTDTSRAVTPAALAAAVGSFVPGASQTSQGKVELATDAETITGTDATRAVTPASLKAATNALLAVIYPVGSVYANYSDSTNPATLFGFGTWVAISGRMLIGQDGATYTPGGTGGAATHSIASGNLPAHAHTVSINTTTTGAHQHTIEVDFDGAGGSSRYTVHRGGGSGSHDSDLSTSVGNHAHTVSGNTGNGPGSGTAINHMNPYVGVYLWRRTA